MKFIEKLIKLAMNTKILFLPKKLIGKMLTYILQCNNAIIIPYNDPEKRVIIDLIKNIKKETEMLLSINEAYQIFSVVKQTKKINGDIAEVGVYKGGSSKLICEAKDDRLLHLFDTFEGIPKVDEIDGLFHRGQFKNSLENVKTYLSQYKNVYFYRGLFPYTARFIKNKKFSFVHLDVDTYESTLNCLRFFYTNLNPGGVIILHDYSCAAGVKKAVDQFFEDKHEAIIELPGTQCLITKLK